MRASGRGEVHRGLTDHEWRKLYWISQRGATLQLRVWAESLLHNELAWLARRDRARHAQVHLVLAGAMAALRPPEPRRIMTIRKMRKSKNIAKENSSSGKLRGRAAGERRNGES